MHYLASLFKFCALIGFVCGFFPNSYSQNSDPRILVGAERTNEYYPKIKNKNIALVVNHTSRIGNVHLVDSLLSSNFTVSKIFAPEHGFRGNFGAGEAIKSEQLPESNLTVISLYGKSKKPTNNDLQGIDCIIFDIQDVGARFYTYISTLEFVMEAAAENSIPLIVLDRPNPNGNTISGPVLNNQFQSFVGRQEIPVLYGMTIAEYALYLQGELDYFHTHPLDLQVVSCLNYDRQKYYELPIPPSPNLPNMLSVMLYPSLCLFEGTDFSEGRGTDYPFQIYGHPEFQLKDYLFSIKNLPHAKNPKWVNKEVYGRTLTHRSAIELFYNNRFDISYLLDAYYNTGSKETFFKQADFFDKLVGSDSLRKQISKEMSQIEIEESWVPEINIYKEKRKKYLIYPDF
jgi:uncharacterized protein YbbC (DUF1343 family)